MPKIETKCKQCNASIYRWPSHLKDTKYGPFCDQICLGKFRTEFLIGDLGANFQEGCKKDRKYIRVIANWHRYKDKHGYVSLHRLIAEARTGEYLPPNLVVHHKDGDPLNNHWDNLQITTQSEHMKEHLADGTLKIKLKKEIVFSKESA